MSRARRRGEEATPRTVRPPAPPERAVRARLRLGERHRLLAEQIVSGGAHAHLVGRHDEAITFATAPFAGAVAMQTARDPAVVSKAGSVDEKEREEDERKAQAASEHGSDPFLLARRTRSQSSSTSSPYSVALGVTGESR